MSGNPRWGLGLVTGLAVAAVVVPTTARAQGAVVVDDRGVVFTPADSSFQVIMRFRMQLLATVTEAEDDDLGPLVNGTVRRLRLRFGGYMLDRRLTYNLQLSFSRGDQDFQDTGFSNIVRDAALSYQLAPNLQFTFGQTKLPGNRQRVISSSELQWADRSIVNARFNIDRDFLLTGALRDTLGGVPVHLLGSVSGGEGRNSPTNAEGVAVTGRVEVLPFGPFRRGGDYFEGDLEHEPTPKLSVGATYSHNAEARRTGGQLGTNLFAPRDIDTFLADAVLKYRGLSVYGEYARRDADDPVTTSPGVANRYVYVGQGVLLQAAYHFKGANWEPGVRYAVVDPDAEIAGESGAERTIQVAFGVARYLKRHRVRVHGEFGWLDLTTETTGAERREWVGRVNFELGI